MIASALLPHVISATNGSGCAIPANGALPSTGICTARASIHIPVSYRSIGPILILFVGSLVLLIVSSLMRPRNRPGLWPGLTALIGVFAGVVSALQWADVGHHPTLTIAQQVAYDRFSVLFMLLISVATVLGALSSDSYLRREGLDSVVPYVLMLLAGAGAMLMAASAGLIMVFLGLEIMSISLYVMAAYHRRRRESGEAGLKYFVLGAFSSAIFLYGVALMYGATGSTQFVEMGQFLATNTLAHTGVLLAGIVLVIVGLGFKVAAVPFHFWTPDVYQGSPTPFTGYMAAVAKAAGFAALVRVLMQGVPTQQSNWRPAIWLIAVLTLLVGSVLAIAQRDVKRMLAYSSISQAGYVLIGVQAGTTKGSASVAFFLFTYTFIIIGSFMVVSLIQGEGEGRNDLGALRGLSRRRPALAGAMLVFLLAQAGVPLTSGFLGKFYVIQAAVQQGQYWLAVIGMLAAAVAAFFYLRVALLMYSGTAPSGEGADDGTLTAGLRPVRHFDDVPGNGAPVAVLEQPPATKIAIPPADAVVLAVCVVFTIFAGVSGPIVELAQKATLIF
ncbi:MAG: NADH-quinone oxidoreductase subunit N [Acidimicrobiaceae bacterium]|nr:NADH-quinone oxidoreductase subunit N [Acidimicrobiaceae bacterium]